MPGLSGPGGLPVPRGGEADTPHPPGALVRSDSGAKTVQRFEREVRIMRKLDHPHLPGTIDGGVDDNGMPYLAMEYLDGRSLYDLVSEHPQSPTSWVAALGVRIADGLSAAHAEGVVRRDLKPSNGMLVRGGDVKVLDFDMGRIVGEADATRVTSTGVTVGTARYMAPEQFEAAAVSPAADLYALGVLFELLTGVPPFLATSMGFNRARDPWRPGPVFRYAFELAGDPSRPRLCFLSTGMGDRQASIDAFYAAFAGSQVRTSHLALFEQPNVPDVAAHLRDQDVIWVDRGSVVNLLAVWRAHGLPEILADCWRAGVVLAGESAGSLCWHTGAITDSYGGIHGVADGLGLVPYANAVHYGEGGRRSVFHQFIVDSAADTARDDGVVGMPPTPALACTTSTTGWWRRSLTGRARARTELPAERMAKSLRNRWRSLG